MSALDRLTAPCATRLDNQPTPSARPWRYGHAASIEGAHWDIYAGEGIDGWLVGMVTTEADAALIVETVNAAAPDPAPLDVERLARAVSFVMSDLDWTPAPIGVVQNSYWQDRAESIAREYAKEPQP